MVMVWKGLCNENQLDVLFILNLFLQSTSTCFGHICNPSSEGIPYIYHIYQLLCVCVYIYIYIYIYIYTRSIPPDDGLQICPKYVEVD